VRLRDIEETDLALLLKHRNDRDTREWLGDSRLVCIDDHYKWFLNPAETNYWIAEKQSMPIGLARVKQLQFKEFEIGCDVFRGQRGNGYGHEVFRLAMEKAVKAGAKRLSLWVFVENVRAVKVYLKAGFQFDENEPMKVLMRDGLPRHYARMEAVVVR
jgi:RimJ/RimL family protein N-acetyltransferase